LVIGLGSAMIAAADVMIQRSSSFTDRRHVWSYLWRVSGHRRIVGYGFGAFWGDDTNVAPISTPDFRWDAAHNSFVEIYIGMGLVGIIVIMIFLGFAARAVYLRVRSRRTLQSMFPAMLVAFLLVENMSESMILYHSSAWILLIAAPFLSVIEDRDQMLEHSTQRR
jgi:O-antigen ligase